MTGTLALIGGSEWREGCDFDVELLAASNGDEVVVLPTAAAYEHPERAVATATEWFGGLGARVRPAMVLGRSDAEDPEHVRTVRGARFVYLGGGSALHLRSVLKDSPVWHALVEAWNDGAVLAGSSAGAMVLCDPMVDPRGGAFTLGLGLVAQLAVIPHADTWSPEKARRTYTLAPKGCIVAAIDERTALVRRADATWEVVGVGQATAWRDGRTIEIPEIAM